MSGDLGSIGFALPATMGAWAAVVDTRQIVSISGDGGFGHYPMELTTAVKYGMNLTHIVLNNSELAKISKEQRGAHLDVWQTGLHNLDFAVYAEFCGAVGVRVTDAADLDDALTDGAHPRRPGARRHRHRPPPRLKRSRREGSTPVVGSGCMPKKHPIARNPRQEAGEIAGSGLSAVVIEPSPPAVTTEPWFADDPVECDDATGPILAPAGLGADRSWDDWLVDHPEYIQWVADRWLGGARRLPPVPPSLENTRNSLHRLAAYVIAPTRHRSVGRFGLRWTLGGFGTPFFDDDRQIRVERNTLVDQRGSIFASTAITTLDAAAAFLGTDIDPETAAEHDTPPVGNPDELLVVEPASSEFLGAWFGMSIAALEVFRSGLATIAPSRPQIWPGHFDAAIESGDDNHRASYGASPGDTVIAEPYLYVSIWWPNRVDIDESAPVWNASAFTGRVLRVSEFDSGDPVEVATKFWSTTRDLLG